MPSPADRAATADRDDVTSSTIAEPVDTDPAEIPAQRAGQMLTVSLRDHIVEAWRDADTELRHLPDDSPHRTFARAQLILEIVETIGEQVRHDGMPRAEYEALESLVDDIIDRVSVLALRSKRAEAS